MNEVSVKTLIVGGTAGDYPLVPDFGMRGFYFVIRRRKVI